MSLSNPNKVVTEQRLNEYHNAILPYLGGMPDILANKFSKADLYSTDEKIVGQWIDGKPLYQKTIDTTITSGWNTINHSIANIDTIFLSESFIQNSSGTARKIGGSTSGTELFGAVTNTSIAIYNTDTDYTKAVVTIQYTKTTDSSVEIGVDTDYSTTEKIVGTWIDGKPIYQKTLVESNPLTGTSKTIDLSAFNIDTPVKVWGFGVNTDTVNQYTPFIQGDSICSISRFSKTEILLEYNSNYVSLRLTGGYILHIQYTKTTD